MSSIISLAKAYEKYFKIGAAVAYGNIEDYEPVLSQHFNSITPENEMKFSSTEPEEGSFTFERADRIFDVAKRLGIKVRAHAPVWHNQTGEWMYKNGDGPASPELIYERIDRHFKALCERYGDNVYAWDVVNEAVKDDFDDHVSREGALYRESTYFKLCGADFIAESFKAMDKYAPNAQLFYNDYNECMPEKRQRIVELIRTVQEKGCRIDGFGMQQHYFFAPDYDELKRSIETYAGLGLRLHITELDVSLMASVDRSSLKLKPEDKGFAEYMKEVLAPTPERLAATEEIYLKLFEIYRSYSDVIDCVTTWGVADDYSWLNGFVPDKTIPLVQQYPLLFDRSHEPKDCVKTLIEKA